MAQLGEALCRQWLFPAISPGLAIVVGMHSVYFHQVTAESAETLSALQAHDGILIQYIGIERMLTRPGQFLIRT